MDHTDVTKITADDILRRKFAEILDEFGEIYEVMGEPFRATAYQRGAHKVHLLPLTQEKYGEVKGKLPRGIGESMWSKWVEFQAHGRVKELEKLRRDPKVKAFRVLSSVMGVGHKVAMQWIDMGIKNIAGLRRAVTAGKVQLTAAQTLGLRHYDDLSKRVTREQVEIVFRNISGVLGGFHMELVGSYRRGLATSGDVDILVEVPSRSAAIIAKIVDGLEGLPLTGWVLKGTQRMTFLYKVCCVGGVKSVDGASPASQVVQCDLLLATKEEWPAALMYFTGSKLYNEYLRSTAKKRGMLLNQVGLYADGKSVPVRSERDICGEIGVGYLEPEAR